MSSNHSCRFEISCELLPKKSHEAQRRGCLNRACLHKLKEAIHHDAASMAASKTEVNPFLRRSPGQRIQDALRSVLRLPGQAWRGFHHWPKHLRYLVVVLGVIAIAGAAAFGARYYFKRVGEQNIAKEKAELNELLRQANPDREKCFATIAKILEIEPTEPLALSRKKALQTGEGDPTDAIMMQYLFREHQRNNKPDDLLRECAKRLQHEPRDFEAHFLSAKTKLEKGDAAGAETHLNALAHPEVNSVNLNFVPVSGALQLLQRTNRDVTNLRSFIAENIMKLVKSVGIADADHGTQLLVLYLYSEALALPKTPLETAEAWPYVEGLIDACQKGAEKQALADAGDPKKQAESVNAIRNLGSVSAQYANALIKMRNASLITEPQRVAYSAALEARIQRAWNYVLQKDPKSPDAYVGLIETYARSGDNRKAIETLMAGLDACGDHPQLLDIFTRVSILGKNEMAGYERLKEAGERNPKVPLYWILAAQAAAACERRDLAMKALEKAREVLPKEPEILVREASLFTGTGYPEKVLACLSPIPDADLVRMPRACEFFVRALAEIGDRERLDAALEAAMSWTGSKSPSPVPAYYAALGLHEAVPPSADRASKTAAYILPITERWQHELKEASQLYAACLVRVAELKPGPFDPVAAEKALRACERAVLLDPNHVPTVTNKLFLLIRTGEPQRALREIDPLLARINDLTPEQAEVLGMVYNANKQYDDTIRVIDSTTRARKNAGCWIQLAIAYHGQGRAADAENALRNASQLPMSDRERADYDAARDLLTRVKP
jgi:tetratricopeptide (TPR) repeat protein